MNTKNAISAVIGAAFATGALLAPAAHAAENPFGAKSMSSGYMQLAEADKAKEGKCGEGKCGASKKKEGKCGEGKCGADKKKEGKCGEGKCGANKK